MGTTDFASTILNNLVESGYQVKVVATRPNKPAGRKKRLTPPPVKEAAMRLELELWQPRRWDDYWISRAAELEPDLIVTAAYGLILPGKLLKVPFYGAINVHPSLLPAYRGAAPIQRALMDGQSFTGVTILFMSKGIDKGDIILQEKVPIDDQDDYGKLSSRLAIRGGELLSRAIDLVAAGKEQPIPQNHLESTYAPPIASSEEIIDWHEPAKNIYNKIRALSPRPGARTFLRGETLKIYKASLLCNSLYLSEPGLILKSKDELIVGTGKGALKIEELQMAGKKKMDSAAFLRGRFDLEGERLG